MGDVNAVASFAPVARPDARILILGSMPGVASLRAQQYYAHPRNHFWPIMASLVGVDLALPYAQRVQALTESGIAVWDVLQRCVRPGSLDSAIQPGTRVANDFGAFFDAHPAIRWVGFNGAEAEKSFKAYVLPELQTAAAIRYVRLPSTSGAHAIGFDSKLAAWRSALGCP